MRKSIFKGLRKLKYIAILLIIIAIAVLAGVKIIERNSKPEILTTSTIEKILEVSDLSTYEAVYNGVSKVMNENDTEKVDYYVSYESKVQAGINFEEVDISIDEDHKIIKVKLPEIKIIDVNVDIASLDYIFMDNRANTATVSEKAYKKCAEDVENEVKQEKAIYQLAEQNAKNIIEALINPFIEQLDDEYQLVIEGGQ